MKKLLLTVMKRFIELEAVNKKTSKELQKTDVKKKENQPADESIVVCAKSERPLKKVVTI